MTIGKSVPMLDAQARVSGRVPYMINLQVPGMLHAKVLRSIIPHGAITRIDTSAAENLPGVIAVLTAEDFDTPELPNLLYGLNIIDQPVVARDRVRYVGEPVAVVAAETLQAAEAALDLIEVDYDEQPAVYDHVEAMRVGAPVLHAAYPENVFVHSKLRHGDMDAGFAAADEIIEETFTSPMAQQTSLEPHATCAQWDDDHLTIWSGTQAPSRLRLKLAQLFGIEPEQVRVIVPPLGGGYGGKGHIRVEPMAAALARKTDGRPVKLVNTRPEEFVTVTKHAATITIKTGVKRDGTFTARQIKMVWGGGAYTDASAILVPGGMVRGVGPYRVPAVHIDAYGVYTNLPPAAAYRGAMSSQTTWAYESHMDTIADRLGIDPYDLRMKNVLRSGEQFSTGETMHDVHFDRCLEAVADSLDWDATPADRGSGPRRRGRGMAVMMKSTIPTSRSEIRVSIDQDEQVRLFTSTVEMGQGTHTALAQIAAETIGVPLENVTIVGPDTDQTPFDSTSSASRSSNMMGNALLDGSDTMLQRLRELASLLLEYDVDELEAGDGYVWAAENPDERLRYAEILTRHELDVLNVDGSFETKGGIDPETGQGVATPHWHQGSGACEVEVDTETGRVTVLRYHGASFAGRVINPQMAHLQNDGNVIYGMGPAMLEEMVVDGGQIVNTNLSDYMIPSFLDAPRELESILLESDEQEIHGIGEMTLPSVAPAIANAIYDAVGVRIYDLPISSEKVLRGLMALREQENGS